MSLPYITLFIHSLYTKSVTYVVLQHIVIGEMINFVFLYLKQITFTFLKKTLRLMCKTIFNFLKKGFNND